MGFDEKHRRKVATDLVNRYEISSLKGPAREALIAGIEAAMEDYIRECADTYWVAGDPEFGSQCYSDLADDLDHGNVLEIMPGKSGKHFWIVREYRDEGEVDELHEFDTFEQALEFSKLMKRAVETCQG